MDPFTIIYFVVTLILSIALAPKPPGPRAAALDDFDFPVAEEGRPIPVLFGTVDISGPNVLWYGGLSISKIKKKSLFSSTTVGFRYSIGFHLGLCHGPVDAVTRVAWGDKEAWTGNITANGTGNINLQDLFGGLQREGGIVGDFDIAMGGSGQTANAYLDGQISGDIPAFRGITGFIWRGGYVGTTAYVKPVAVRVRRIEQGWAGGVWYQATAAISGGMNGAHVVYEALTNPEWGMGRPTSDLNDTNFRAAADTLFAEGFGLNMIWNQASTIEQFIQIVLDHINGALAWNESTGQFELSLFRGGYNPATLPLFDPSNVISLDKCETQGWGETVNEITLIYTDPDTGKRTSITAQDLANVDAQGARVPQSVERVGIKSHALARTVLTRELNAVSTPLKRLNFTANRAGWNVPYAGLMRFTWPDRDLNQIVVRVLKIAKGDSINRTIKIQALQDIFSFGNTSYLANQGQAGAPTPPSTPADDGADSSNVISATTTTPPGSPADDARYFVPTGATGAWSGQAGNLATWDAVAGAWVFVDVPDGTTLYADDTAGHFEVVGGVAQAPPWSTEPLRINEQSGTTYTLVLADAGRYIRMNNAAANTVTVPANSSVAFPIGTRIPGIRQVGTGATSLVAAGGVTLNGTLALPGQNRDVHLTKVATDTWDIGP